jgi:hypothetical protein
LVAVCVGKMPVFAVFVSVIWRQSKMNMLCVVG